MRISDWSSDVCSSDLCVSALFAGLAGLAIGIGGGIGLFHAGVEYGWWEGLTACSTSPAGGNPADILNQIMATPITRCDVAPWSLLGISMAELGRASWRERGGQ